MLMLTLGVGWSLLRAPDPDALPPGAPAAESTAPAPPAVFPAGGSFALSKVSPVMPARSENWEAFPSVSPVGDDVTGTWDEF
jgi:hypothetical protein